jgi:hypothetical protein
MNTAAIALIATHLGVPETDTHEALEKFWDKCATVPYTPSPRLTQRAAPVPRARRRPSIKKIIREMENLGKHILGIEVAVDGTTRVMIAGEETQAGSASWWDRKLK